ncbi:Uncharacterised protein [Streptococcus pneumoniae]|nr:Uncharacterised protein [Streptococcus pneumoniae]
MYGRYKRHRLIRGYVQSCSRIDRRVDPIFPSKQACFRVQLKEQLPYHL